MLELATLPACILRRPQSNQPNDNDILFGTRGCKEDHCPTGQTSRPSGSQIDRLPCSTAACQKVEVYTIDQMSQSAKHALKLQGQFPVHLSAAWNLPRRQ